MKQQIVNFVPPPLNVVDNLLIPMHRVLQAELSGLEQVPTDYPCLYVMNHSLMGLEMPSFIHALYKEKGVFLRGLADHLHFAGPQGALLRACWAVDGTRANVDVLMENKQNILVYPGGGAEIMKHSSVGKYTLMWKERLGFARMAIKHGYPIMPCACVGTEDMLDIVMDLPVSFLAGAPPSIPVVAPNSLQKMYFWFGEPIPTAQYSGDSENTGFAKEVRDKTKTAVEAGIKQMQQRQATDPDRYVIRQLAERIKHAQTAAANSLKAALTSKDVDNEAKYHAS